MRAAELPAAIHVQSLRLASGQEALVARFLGRGGAVGFGFTLNLQAHVARELAAWDARARRAGAALAALLGDSAMGPVPAERDTVAPVAAHWQALRAALRGRRLQRLRFDLWGWGGIGPAQRAAALAARSGLELALVCPHAHPWELAVCAGLAAAHRGRARVILAGDAPATLEVPPVPGLGVDWALEPGFAALEW